MSVFDRLNQTAPTGGSPVSGVFWCQEEECFDVLEEAMLIESRGIVYWTCEEGHKNKMEHKI